MSLIREDLDRLGVSPNCVLQRSPKGRRLQVSGIVLVRQRPSTANGIVFCTLEDETGNACRCGTPGEIFEDPCEGGAEL